MVAATNIKFFLINLITQNNFVDQKNLHQFYPTISNLPFRFIALPASTMERNKKFSEEEEEEELNQNESISLRISFYFHLEINKL